MNQVIEDKDEFITVKLSLIGLLVDADAGRHDSLIESSETYFSKFII